MRRMFVLDICEMKAIILIKKISTFILQIYSGERFSLEFNILIIKYLLFIYTIN